MTPTDLLPVLEKLGRQMHTLQARYLEHLGLRMVNTLILREINSLYGITQSQLCYRLKLDKSTVSRAIRMLIAARYVKKGKDPADRRSCHLLSTNMTKVLMPNFDIADQDLAKALLLGFSDKETEEFGKYLRRASSNVDHVLNSPPVNRFQPFYLAIASNEGS